MFARNSIVQVVMLTLVFAGSGIRPAFAQAEPYIPPPAAAYGLNLADIGPEFREVVREEVEGGRAFLSMMLATDARVDGDRLLLSNQRVTLVRSMVFIEPYGSNDDVTGFYNTTLDALRGRFQANVEPAVGWGSEQVYSYAWAERGQYFRGILLKHRNAVALIETIGLERFATWGHISPLMATVERRIHAAVQ
jgi:hypothetical protein